MYVSFIDDFQPKEGTFTHKILEEGKKLLAERNLKVAQGKLSDDPITQYLLRNWSDPPTRGTEAYHTW